MYKFNNIKTFESFDNTSDDIKVVKFSTSLEDLTSILSDISDLSYELKLKNTPELREILCEITANEDVLHEIIQRSDLYDAIGEVKDLNESYNNESNEYLSLDVKSNGLEISLTEEGKNFIEEQYDVENLNEDIFYDLFESIQGNSDYMYFDNLGDVGMGMTSAPGITDGYTYSDDGEGLVESFPIYGKDDSRRITHFLEDLKASHEKGGRLYKTVLYILEDKSIEDLERNNTSDVRILENLYLRLTGISIANSNITYGELIDKVSDIVKEKLVYDKELEANLYFYEPYQIKSFIEELYEKGKTFFNKA